jgi:iron(III) transport system substrate-binding protein
VVHGQQDKSASSAEPEWNRVIDGARKEGKVTVSLPASAELKRQIEEGFKKRFGIEVEVFTARGSAGVRRMADEFKAGVRHFDLHIGGSSSIISGMLDEGIIDPIEAWMALPEVKDPKQWWGGHLWVDKAKRFIYSFQAFLPQTIYYNTDLAKPEELRSMDDFLNPKWKGKIGLLDPRSLGGGDANWSYMWQVKGEEFLKSLTGQDLYLGRDQRVLAESLAKGRVAVTIGLSYYSFLPFLKAGLPIKALPTLKEGTYGTSGSGNWRSSKRRRTRTPPGFSLIGCWGEKARRSFPVAWVRRRAASTSTPAGCARWARSRQRMRSRSAITCVWKINRKRSSKRCANPRSRQPMLS